MRLKSTKGTFVGAHVGLMMMATAAYAAPVTLASETNGFSIMGEVVHFDGTTYTVSTSIGEMQVQADMVTCTGADCPEIIPVSTDFRIAGSLALTDRLVPSLIVSYSKSIMGATGVARNDNGLPAYHIKAPEGGSAEVTLEPSTSSHGMDALLNNQATFAVTSRAAREGEIDAARTGGMGELTAGTQQQIVAIDALMLATHPSNPVRAITEANAARVFSGEITNWAELGWQDAPINLYSRDADSGTTEVFDNLIMRAHKKKFTTNMTVLDSDWAVARAIMDDPNGFGVTSRAHAGGVSTLAVEGVCGMRTPANEFTIKTGEYPLTRLLYMYQSDDSLTGHAAGFADFVNSAAGQDTVTRAGFVNQSIVTEAINVQGVRIGSAVMNNDTPETMNAMREMMQILLVSERLSTTYRFRDGTTQLDTASQALVKRLADLLVTDDYQDRNVYFLGFSDSIGRADLNQLLALQRAENVRLALIQEAPELASRIKSRSVGYGELSPIGCNETRFGRNLNRRVEVWVEDIATTPSES